MISYNPKDWIAPILYFHKADTFRKLFPLLIAVGFFTFFIGWLEVKHLKLNDSAYVKNITIMHNLLGFAISMLLVFRTNTAYDRWWEGRKLWGSLVNNSRNLAVKLDVLLPENDINTRRFFSKIISLFARELSNHLHKEKTRLMLDTTPHPEIPDFDRKKHIPAQIIVLMQRKITALYKSNNISGDQLIILNPEVQSFLDICGACERIKNTPIPYSYSTFIKKFVTIYVLTLPLGFAFSLGYLAIPVVMFIFYVLASLELIAEEIEDPFGNDVNDLPMEKLAENITGNIEEILLGTYHRL